MMLADFHIHTTFSDGKLSLPEVIDLYGQRGFGAIAITDHVGESQTVIGKAAGHLGLCLTPATFPLYLEILKSEAERVKHVFGRLGPDFYCAPAPFIWSAKVWESLDLMYLRPQNLTLWDLCTADHPETLLYIEALLNYKTITLHPIEQLFRIYYYDWQYFLLRRQGENQKKLTKNYLGVIYQSNWESAMDFGAPKKSIF